MAEVQDRRRKATRSSRKGGRSPRPPGAPELDVFDSVKQWKQRRRPPLDDRNVADAIRNLNLIGWLDLAESRKLTVVGDGDVDA